ncbi:MAG TPA: PEGA domain-containing protein [Bacteroidota bacterium]|nr:PEGA domain-containing protein [Bacteroidota bacterium]
MKKILLLLVIYAGILSAQTLNRQMVMDSVWESTKLNVAYPDKALIVVHSQVANLLFDEPNRNLQVEKVGSGDWNVYLTPGTARLKVNADGFQQLELQPLNFKRKQTYEMKISALGFTSLSRADENLFEVVFQLNMAEVYAWYGNLTPILSKSKLISYKVPKGQFTFRFQKAGYVDELRTVSVTGNLQIPITMKAGSGTASTLKLPGFIVMQSDPPGAEILVNGQKIGTTPGQFDLVAGSYQLELRKPLYYPEVSTFDVKENETKEITRVLRSRFGFLSVTSTLQGASVYLDDKLLGSTPIEKRSIESGRHTLRVDLPLYHSHTEEFTIKDGESKRSDVTLKPAFGSLEITSAPESGADVYLDEVKVGVTPFSNPMIASGKYLLRVSKNLFTDVEEEITVLDGFPMRRSVILGSNFGVVNILAADQTIFIDDREVGLNSYTARLKPRKYIIRAERGEAYKPETKEVYVSIGEPQDVTLDAAPRLGSISVVVEPFEARGAEIFVNNELKGKSPTSFPLIIGTHSIVARCPDFLDLTQSVTVGEGEQKKVTLTMITYEGSRRASIDAWGRSAWISTGVTVLATAAAFYMHSETDKYYDAYKLAGTPDAAQLNRDKTQKFTKYTNIAIGAAITGGVAAIFSWLIQKSY